MERELGGVGSGTTGGRAGYRLEGGELDRASTGAVREEGSKVNLRRLKGFKQCGGGREATGAEGGDHILALVRCIDRAVRNFG